MNLSFSSHAVFALTAITVISMTGSFRSAQAADAAPPADPGRGPARGGRVASLDELFATLDRDRDGRISRDEATGPYAQRFPQWDANGDGFATREEVHDFRQRLGIEDSGLRSTTVDRDGATAGKSGAGPAGSSPRDPGGSRRAGAEGAATILHEPQDWRLETMPIPPGFAPGMFDPASSTYFTCVLAILAGGAPPLGAAEIKDFLEKYYGGLSVGVGRRKGLSPDPEQMRAVVIPASPGPDQKSRFEAQVVFFDTFSDGHKITLNAEALVLALPARNKTCLLLLVSPSAKASAVWPTLRAIEKQAVTNVLDRK
jgi:hypothetical protein